MIRREACIVLEGAFRAEGTVMVKTLGRNEIGFSKEKKEV